MGLPILSLITPANAGVIENGNVRLSASYTDTVHAYIADVEFEIDTVNTFDSANLESHLYEDVPSATTLVSFFELADGLYYWRVIATNTTGTTVSSVQNFTVSDKCIRALYTYANVGKYSNLEKRALYTIANVGKFRELKKRALYTFENIAKKYELKARALYEYENITDDPPWPTIYNISGTRFSQGAELTITGSGFGFSTANDIANEDRFERSYDGSVIFGGQSVNVISWSWNSITVTLPSDAESGSLFVRLSSPTVRDSNLVGVEVYEAEVADDIGVEFYLCDHKQPNTVIKQLAFARNKSFQVLLNGAGSGSFEIDLADASGISDKMAVLCRLDGVDVHKWIIERLEPVKANAEEKQILSCSGRGMMALLERAVVYPETMQGETERVFSGVHGGDILRQLLLEAQHRGAIPYVSLDWTAGFDSIGQPWEDLTDVSFHVGTPLLSVVDKLSNGLGLFDIEMTPNLKLKIYHRHGTDVSDEVVYELGQAIIEHSAPSQSDGLVNVALVEGEKGIMIEVSDGTSPATWGRHEGYLQSRNVPDELSLDAFGRAFIDYSAQPERSIIGRVAKFVYEDGRKIKPFESYLLGDWVGWYVDDFEIVRVKGITVEEDTETGEPSYTLDLNNILLERQIRMNQQLSRVSMNSADSPLTSTGDKPPLTELPAHNHSHSALTGLDNDDHPQYLNEERHLLADHSAWQTETAYSTAQAGGYLGSKTDFETDLASIEGLAAAIAAIVGG